MDVDKIDINPQLILRNQTLKIFKKNVVECSDLDSLMRGDPNQLFLASVNLLPRQWPHPQHHTHIFRHPWRHS